MCSGNYQYVFSGVSMCSGISTNPIKARITDNSAQRQVCPGQLGPEKSRPKTTRPKSSQFQKTTRPEYPQLLKTSRPMNIRLGTS